MTMETTEPQEMEGQGDGAAHRRRRRRRKHKSGPSQPQQQQQPQQTQPKPQQQAPQPFQNRPQQQLQSGGGQGQGGGRKRKKKFFEKNRAPKPVIEPGNSIAHASKQKVRQRGPREFVGPMDHSYLSANGNVADGPPSTIPLRSNAHYSQPFHNSNNGAGVAAEDAATRIYCFIEDLFFQAKINESAKKLGVKVEFVKGDGKETLARLLEADEAAWPKLVVIDLNTANAKPRWLIPKLKSKFKKATSVIGFLSHLQGDLKVKAMEEGCDTVMPRSAFSQSLPNLLRRYGIEEEEDNSRQPNF